MPVKLVGVKVVPARASGGPLYRGRPRTEPAHVAAVFSAQLAGDERVELWSGDGPGSYGSTRLASLPALFEGRAALFNLRLGLPWSPPRLTAVFADQRLTVKLDALDAAAFEQHLVAGVLRVFPRFASGADNPVLSDDSDRTLRIAVEEHRTLVTDVVRVPVDVVRLPPLSPDSSLMRALGGSTSLSLVPGATPDGQAVHVWETRVIGRETVSLPTLVARYRERFAIARGLDPMMRISHRTCENDVLSPDTVPVDPRFRLTIVARDARLALTLLSDPLLEALDDLLRFPGTRRVMIDQLGLRTSVSTSSFSGDTAPKWLGHVLEVSGACRRALSRLT
jgi:hypothetical protein